MPIFRVAAHFIAEVNEMAEGVPDHGWDSERSHQTQGRSEELKRTCEGRDFRDPEENDAAVLGTLPELCRRKHRSQTEWSEADEILAKTVRDISNTSTTTAEAVAHWQRLEWNVSRPENTAQDTIT